MTENQLEKRYTILSNMLGENKNKYLIKLDGSFISIRNKFTLDGIYTDSLQAAKKWIAKDIGK